MPMVIVFFVAVIIISAYGAIYHPINSLMFTILSVVNIIVGLLLVREFADALINYDHLEFSEEYYEDADE
jgi:cell shape-determining protein MreC